MKKVEFITPPDAEFGFSLSGVPQKITETPDAEKVITQTMVEPDIGLAVVDERLITGMTDERLRELEHSWQGIFLILPSPLKPPPEVEDYAARLIRRAIGYHVRLKL
ncbi:MAG TPA: ATPase [Nitrospirota bacterium]|nr:ATPase [Nitrospirota bacterium]